MPNTTPQDDEDVIFRFGEYTYDCGSHLFLRDDEEVRLSRKAKTLLRLLLMRCPGVVAREELYDALWPSTFVCETNLATIISEVRRALGDDARSSQYIRTVHGLGYAFAGEVTRSTRRPIPVALLLCDGERHPLYDGENVVGRAQDCRAILTGPTVSRHHAVIVITRSDIRVEDLNSTNGTYLNGQKITMATIHYQDRLMFGASEATIVRKTSATLPLGLRVYRTASGRLVYGAG